MSQRAELQHLEESPTQNRPALRILKVGRRTYRRRSARDRRAILAYPVPELRLSNVWLQLAGFEPGDFAAVSSPRAGFLIISRVPKAV